MMATVDLDHVNKVYENGFHAVKADGMQFFDPDTERAIWT
jgi:hypothetical protein